MPPKRKNPSAKKNVGAIDQPTAKKQRVTKKSTEGTQAVKTRNTRAGKKAQENGESGAATSSQQERHAPAHPLSPEVIITQQPLRGEQGTGDSTRPKIIGDVRGNVIFSAAPQRASANVAELAVGHGATSDARDERQREVAVDDFEPHASSSEVGERRRIPAGATTTVSEHSAIDSPSFEDPIKQLASALHSTLINFRDSTLNENNSRLINRLTTAKTLPTFSGDALEWINFKQTFESTSELGGYTDRENVTRLFEALRGEARDAVSTLLASSDDAKSIMHTLDLHYGNKKLLAKKIVNELKNLPDIESGKIKLSLFASKLRNAVAVLRSHKLTGYLYNPELIESIGNKIPTFLKYSYNTYAETVDDDKPDL